MEMAKEGGKRGKKGKRRKERRERGHCDTVAAKRTKGTKGDERRGIKRRKEKGERDGAATASQRTGHRDGGLVGDSFIIYSNCIYGKMNVSRSD